MTPVAAYAQQHESGHGQAEPAGPPPHVPTPPGIETASADETEHGHWHKHHAGFFAGGSTYKENNGVTVGGDYEFRLTKYFGLGAAVEHAFGSLKETVVAFPVFFHPGAGLRLGMGPGFERYTGDLPEEHAHHGEATHDDKAHFLWRFQALYDFPVGKRFTITPNLALDIQSGRQVFVYGVTFGVGF
jgi:hypothetical protein